MSDRTLQITNRIIERPTEEALPGLRVEWWDKARRLPECLGSAVTDDQGKVEFKLKESYVKAIFADRQPDFYFKIYRNDKMLTSTEDSILWNPKDIREELVIALDSPASNAPIVWNGEHEFQIVGTELHEDTLRIVGNYKQSEQPLELILPTLCITYADMQFTNAIGGQQEDYPVSRAYGPNYFDPPVEIWGETDVEKFTWIRGAHHVVIGPEQTLIQWYMWKPLVIPRLRISQKNPINASLRVGHASIRVDEPLSIGVMQYADGRHIGGIRVEKRHPNWRPEQKPKKYDLWLRVVDGETMQPIPEAKVNFYRWDAKIRTSQGKGGFQLVDQNYTNGQGAIHFPGRPSDELEAVTLDSPGWRAVSRCFRPLSGQRVRFHLRARKLEKDALRYTWKEGDNLVSLAVLTGRTPEELLQYNKLNQPSDLYPGMTIRLPCYLAAYHMEPGDTFEWLAKAFAYINVKELATLNGLEDPAELDGGMGIKLPGWYFFYAQHGLSLDRVDQMFELPTGSSRTVGRVHHPDRRLPYGAETIAVPTKAFVKSHMSG
jgi:LysM repeat protein